MDTILDLEMVKEKKEERAMRVGASGRDGEKKKEPEKEN